MFRRRGIGSGAAVHAADLPLPMIGGSPRSDIARVRGSWVEDEGNNRFSPYPESGSPAVEAGRLRRSCDWWKKPGELVTRGTQRPGGSTESAQGQDPLHGLPRGLDAQSSQAFGTRSESTDPRALVKADAADARSGTGLEVSGCDLPGWPKRATAGAVVPPAPPSRPALTDSPAQAR